MHIQARPTMLKHLSSYVVIAGAYEPPGAVKEHETCTTCQVPSQSKFIAKYFPYKESDILLFEAVYGSDLQYISIRQYIDTLIEYRIVILCSMNIEIFKCLMVLSGACLVL